ncbi:flagellar biosynthetic protein FliO [Janthinobacterium sp. GB4P2]|uniref:flagellar biosynthetic protein FliO n=1 Tax=Janthinobacterium sp. GB4P2 TaxID=3424189 RepID=UPI003F1F7BC3
MRVWLRLALLAMLCAGWIATSAASQPPAGDAVAIPFRHDDAAGSLALSDGSAWAVLLISAAAIGAVVIIRKKLKMPILLGSQPRLVRVLDTQRLGPRSLLSVVEFAGNQYLIAQSEHGITTLAVAPREPAAIPGEQA